MNTRRAIGLMLVVGSVVAALVVFIGFQVPAVMGLSVAHVDAAGNAQSMESSIQVHWSAITLALLFLVGLVMSLLPNKKAADLSGIKPLS